MSNPVNDHVAPILADLADAEVVAAVEARLAAGTAIWGRSQNTYGWTLLSLVQGERTALLEIVLDDEDGNDFEVSEELLDSVK